MLALKCCFFTLDNIHYFLFFILTLIVCDFIPAIKINSTFYNMMYDQKNFNTSHLDLGKLIVITATLFIGYGIMHYKEFRRNYYSRSGLRDLLYMSIYGVLLYFASGNSVLPGEKDYEGFCNGKSEFIFNKNLGKYF